MATTATIRRVFRISATGSASRRTRSARCPTATEPNESVAAKYRAGSDVAVRNASIGDSLHVPETWDDVLASTIDEPSAVGDNQSFLDFPDGEFDLVWCRHCLEHSIFPYLTLSEFNRVLKPGGWLYIEVPAPDTSCLHQTNRNHYSVLGKSMLVSLIMRSGFRMVDVADIGFTVPAGPDTYWSFIQQKISGE